MIRGVLRRDGARSRPFVSASLAIPSLQLSADTAFLVDTGADGTLLAPHDAALLGVDIALLPPGPPSTGVGGAVRTVQTAATITLGPETYNLTLRILAPVTRAQRIALARIPSFLGRDILAHFALFYDHQEELVLLLDPDGCNAAPRPALTPRSLARQAALTDLQTEAEAETSRRLGSFLQRKIYEVPEPVLVDNDRQAPERDARRDGPATNRCSGLPSPRECDATELNRIRRGGLLLDVHSVVLDHRVRQEFAAHLVRLARGFGRIGSVDQDLEVLAGPYALHGGEAERAQAAVDRLALWIIDHGLQEDVDARKPCHGLATMRTYASRYFSAVRATTSSGRGGGGGSWSQPVESR